ncbi:hypothetical protein PGPR2_02690 [Pseudomonas aeruginosa PGPR2]|nr:hypothetical protein PGPR2_02690 [Pseudomonas aeruginosa PGPR2]
MPLRLTITSYHKLTPGQCSEKVLDQGQLTIGRGPDNDWVLPDPERLVSSRHCTILNRDGVYYLTDTSTNGVLLVNAGHRLRRGNSEPLQDGETVRLGEYDILVQLGHDIALPGSGNPQTDPFTSFDALMSRQAAGSAPAFAEPAPTPHPAVTAHFQGRLAAGHQARPVRLPHPRRRPARRRVRTMYRPNSTTSARRNR